MQRIARVRTVLAGSLLWALTLPVHAEHHERKSLERREIQSLEQRWRQAQLAGDVPAMDKLLSEEFLGVTASGQVVTKSQQLDRMRHHALELSTLELSDTKIKISGHLAVVTSLANLDGRADGLPLKGAFRYTRVYQHEPGDGWKITNFEATRVGVPGGDASPAPAKGTPILPAIAPNSHAASRGGPLSPQPRS